MKKNLTENEKQKKQIEYAKEAIYKELEKNKKK